MQFTLGGLWGTGKLADKTFSAMTSAQNANGGQETTLQTLYAVHHGHALGAILVPPGDTDPVILAPGGNPYGSSVTADGNGLSDADKATIRYQGNHGEEAVSVKAEPEASADCLPDSASVFRL